MKEELEIFVLLTFVQMTHMFVTDEQKAELERRVVTINGRKVVRVRADEHNPWLLEEVADRPADFVPGRTNPGLAERLQALRNKMKKESKKSGKKAKKKFKNWRWLFMDINGVPYKWSRPGFSTTAPFQFVKGAFFSRVTEFNQVYQPFAGTPNVSTAHMLAADHILYFLQRGPVTFHEICAFRLCKGKSVTKDFSGGEYTFKLERTMRWNVDGTERLFRVDVAVLDRDGNVVFVVEVQKTCANKPAKTAALLQNAVENAQVSQHEVNLAYGRHQKHPTEDIILKHSAEGHTVAAASFCAPCQPVADAEDRALLERGRIAEKEKEGSAAIRDAKAALEAALKADASEDVLDSLLDSLGQAKSKWNAHQEGDSQMKNVRDLKRLRLTVASVKSFDGAAAKAEEALTTVNERWNDTGDGTVSAEVFAAEAAATALQAARRAVRDVESRSENFEGDRKAAADEKLRCLQQRLDSMSSDVRDKTEAARTRKRKRETELTASYGGDGPEDDTWLRGRLWQALKDSASAVDSKIAKEADEARRSIKTDGGKRYADALKAQGSYADPCKNPVALAAYALNSDGKQDPKPPEVIMRLSPSASSHAPSSADWFVCIEPRVWNSWFGVFESPVLVDVRVKRRKCSGIPYLLVDHLAQLSEAGGGGDVVEAEERYEKECR